MPKQAGAIRGVNGKLGDFVFYELAGEAVLRRAGKVSKARYAQSPEFEELRRNQSEFGLASKLAKTVRQSISTEMEEQTGSRISGRLTGVFRKILQAGVGQKGQRGLESENLWMLDGFPLNGLKPFDGSLVCGKFLKLEEDRKVVRLTTSLAGPQGESAAAALVVGVVMLSEVLFDKEYKVIYPGWHGLSFFTDTAAEEAVWQGVSTEIKFKMEDAIPGEVAVIGVVGRKMRSDGRV